MANLTSIGAELLRSGEHSDFTLVCGGREFRVHKVFVCQQSPVIAAAMKGNFKEAKTKTIEVDFDIEALKCMLEYMYTGQYKEPAQAVQPSPSSENKQQAQTTAYKEAEKKPTASRLPENLSYHLRMNSIADYYGVTGLAKTTATRIERLLREHWSADTFCDLLQEVTGSTGDKNLRNALVRVATVNILDLMGKDMFSKGIIANDLAADMLKSTISFLEYQNSQVQTLKSQIQAGEDKAARLEENLEELANVSSKARYCARPNCKQFFGWEAKEYKDNSAKRWMLCCCKCSGRYTWDRNRFVFHENPNNR